MVEWCKTFKKDEHQLCNKEESKLPEIYDRKGNLKVILPPGTEVSKVLSDRDRTVYVCPDGDIIEVNKRERTIRNTSKNIDLGEY